MNLDSMSSGHTPRRSPHPRSPRARSQPLVEMDDYEDRRRERRESRREEPEPVGYNFRLQACETSLRDHHSELAAQRLMLQQLTKEMESMISERETRSQRLDGVMDLVDQRFKESQVAIAETQNAAALKLDGLTATINNLSTGLAGRIELLVLEMQVMKREMPPPGIHPSGVTNDEYAHDGRRAPTQVPSSWASMSAPHPGATQEQPQRAQEQPREHFNISSPLSGPSPTFGIHGPADPIYCLREG